MGKFYGAKDADNLPVLKYVIHCLLPPGVVLVASKLRKDDHPVYQVVVDVGHGEGVVCHRFVGLKSLFICVLGGNVGNGGPLTSVLVLNCRLEGKGRAYF